MPFRTNTFHVFGQLIIIAKKKNHTPGPPSSFFRPLCASLIGLGFGPNTRCTFGGRKLAKIFRVPWDGANKKSTLLVACYVATKSARKRKIGRKNHQRIRGYNYYSVQAFLLNVSSARFIDMGRAGVRVI